MPSSLRLPLIVGLGALFGVVVAAAGPQSFSEADRDLAHQMLRNVASDVQVSYYDAALHGVDWKDRVRQANENIDKAESMDAAISEIAALLDTLNDSHTNFFPPPRSNSYDYGFKLRVIGDRCFVVRVRPGSDAERKGIKTGDVVLTVNDIRVSRKTLWRINYIVRQLRPQSGLRLTVAGEGVSQRQIDIAAKIEPSNALKYFLHQGVNQMVRDWGDAVELMEPRFFEKGDDLLVVQLPAFTMSAEEVDHVLGKMRAHKGAVLDLRGNPGGFVDTVDRLIGGLFQHDLSIYDRVTRTGTKHVSVSGRGHSAFVGRFAVLIDSESASASEILARAVQLERRGFVIGDRSAGMVMESQVHRHELYTDSRTFYGASITEADLLMSDRKSLEHVGVEPDISLLPTAQDITAKRDPALSKAATLVGSQLTPEEAGTAFKELDPKQY